MKVWTMRFTIRSYNCLLVVIVDNVVKHHFFLPNPYRKVIEFGEILCGLFCADYFGPSQWKSLEKGFRFYGLYILGQPHLIPMYGIYSVSMFLPPKNIVLNILENTPKRRYDA